MPAKRKTEFLEQMDPKVFRRLLEAIEDGTLTLTDIASRFGMSTNVINRLRDERGLARKRA